MTWVIGASSIFGYGAIMADVRITFSNGHERDMLQKAYPLGPYIIGGFAGSVKIGFELLHSLQYGMAPPASAGPPDSVWTWEPVGVAHEWQPIAKTIFANAEPGEQALQSQILIVGISHEDLTSDAVKAPKVIQRPHAIIIRMMSPEFEPLVTSRPLSIEHIGSGAFVDKYVDLMKHYVDPMSGTLQAETAAFGMWPKMLARGVRQAVSDDPVSGISPHVHILVCRSGQMFMMNNDTTIVPTGKDPIEFKMPKVAQSYAEFLAMCNATGIIAAGARS
jgi:hypothetical protein